MTSEVATHSTPTAPGEVPESAAPPSMAPPAPPSPSATPALTTPPSRSAATSFAIPDMPRAFWVCAGGIAATFLGLMGTWATVFIVSVNGLDTGDGKLLAAAAALAALALFKHAQSGSKRSITTVLVLGVLCCLGAILEIVNFSGEEMVSIGWGLYLDVFAGATVAVAAFVLRKRV